MTSDALPSLPTLCSQSITSLLPPSAVSTYLSQPPFTSLPGSLNMRCLTSPTLPSGLIYRSGTLSQIPAASLSQLRTTYNIRTIYDLRRADERETAPSPVIDGVETVWMPSTAEGTVYWPDKSEGKRRKEGPPEVPTAAFAEGDGVEAWRKFYANILHTHGHIFKAVLEMIRDGGVGEEVGAVLFHYTAGRDRTGVLATLLLALCRTPRALIARDYLLTRIGIEPHRVYLFQNFFGISVSIASAAEAAGGMEKEKAAGVREICEVRESSILAFLDWIDKEWGGGGRVGDTVPGVHGWLVREIGFREGDRDRVIARLGEGAGVIKGVK